MSTAKKAAARRPTRKAPPLKLRTRNLDGKKVHWYEVSEDGGPLKSAKGRGVTTILGNGLPANGLKVWGENKVADCALDERDIWEPLADKDRGAAYEYLRKASDRDRDEAGNRGTEVHNYAELIAKGEEPEVPAYILGHVDAYLDFVETWEPEIVMVEVVGGNWTRHYFGKFDLLVKVKGWWPNDAAREATILVDIKTSRSGPFEKDALQLTAYRHFELIGEPDDDGNVWDLEPMPAVDGVAVLMLSAESFRFIPVPTSLDNQLFAQFLHCLRTAEFLGSGWRQEDKGWSKDVFEDPRLAPHPVF